METKYTLTTADSVQIIATRFDPSTPSHTELLVGSATGVPQQFYARFARFANQLGWSVTTLDYRGVGLSAPSTLRGYQVDYLDWGRKDLSSAVASIKALSPIKPLQMIAHSYGGHSLGLMPNQHEISKVVAFAVGAGWSGHMPWPERLRTQFMWHVLGPIAVPLLGYMPGQIIGGQDLPKPVYQQWRRWCSFPHYFFDDPTMTEHLKLFPKVRMPIRGVNALDDLWALPRSRDAFFKGFTGVQIEPVDLDPKNVGYPIGHMGYFRKGRERIWEDALAWLDQDKFNQMKSGTTQD